MVQLSICHKDAHTTKENAKFTYTRKQSYFHLGNSNSSSIFCWHHHSNGRGMLKTNMQISITFSDQIKSSGKNSDMIGIKSAKLG